MLMVTFSASLIYVPLSNNRNCSITPNPVPFNRSRGLRISHETKQMWQKPSSRYTQLSGQSGAKSQQGEYPLVTVPARATYSGPKLWSRQYNKGRTLTNDVSDGVADGTDLLIYRWLQHKYDVYWDWFQRAREGKCVTNAAKKDRTPLRNEGVFVPGNILCGAADTERLIPLA